MSADERNAPEPESGDGPSDPSSGREPATPAESKWLRVRKSSLVRTDKIAQVSIRRRDDDYFLEVRADRDIHLAVPDLGSAVRALEAIEEGSSDISEWTIPRPFMEE